MTLPRRLNLPDLALGLLLLALLAALSVQMFVPNPLRRAVADEAARFPVEIVTEGEASFLRDRMKPGDRQAATDDGRPVAELVSVEGGDRLRARWRIEARSRRGWRQFGKFVLMPGERVEIYTPGYKYIGWVVEVFPGPSVDSPR